MPGPAAPSTVPAWCRGFEVSKNKYVLLDKEELDAVKLESTRIIDIRNSSMPTRSTASIGTSPITSRRRARPGSRPLAVIQAAMKKQGKVALGSLVLHQRERTCALEPRDGGILLTTLRTHDEIRSSDGVFERNLPKPDPGMLKIAEKIIAQQEADFDPTHFKDRYEDALRELIERKKKGKAGRAPRRPRKRTRSST